METITESSPPVAYKQERLNLLQRDQVGIQVNNTHFSGLLKHIEILTVNAYRVEYKKHTHVVTHRRFIKLGKQLQSLKTDNARKPISKF